MTCEEYLSNMKPGYIVDGGSEEHLVMHELSQRALKITMELNNKYHTKEEIIQLMSELTGQKIDESFGMFPPFYTDCGRNIHIGKNVFINAGCKFQDQGGIYIEDGVLIGHNNQSYGRSREKSRYDISADSHRKKSVAWSKCNGSSGGYDW